MTTMDVAVAWMNLAGALLAVLVNIASGASSPRDWRGLRYSVAGLAAVYALGYALLIAGVIPFVTAGKLLRGISPFAWVIAWCGPAVKASRMWMQLDTAVKTIANGQESKGGTVIRSGG